jgi:cholest-4-en-3-one 26-monooxygenase
LFYSSANFDECVFDRPFDFNILRDPNPHLAFGGNGAHYCIGANWINGVKALRVAYG